ncbi:acetyl-CoA acetyltransferase [Novosphingobium sp. MMS21-SN21R]|uniref:acetyl-CoA acetyltransferase n=1 Tax=Novosphingobium sp. MMS21-SN21R TaxID=2969298 RepID=UPI00288435E6|nr:acetyl-CoA acetyltransferase [Novosphingobium sp. MMS21-SN21R]MDT0509765.1 acetyl-CoA acetyltransferase [Novosphingobium sp. MMS21-SN21R]
MSRDPSRIPVIVGVGEVNDRPLGDQAGQDSVQLMLGALAAANADAGGGWMERCARIFVVPQLSFSEIDVPAALAGATGMALGDIRQADVPSGDTPVRLLNDAANAIGAGEVAVCAIVGAEAMRTALRSGKPLFPNAAKSAPALRRRYGLLQPSEIYPLYENASRAELGQSLAEGQAETGAIWSRMSAVAAQSEGAWLRQSKQPDEIIVPSVDNRPIAFPYTKLMIANASVNQGAAVIVTSLAVARQAGIAEDRIVHIGAGTAAHEPHEAMDRAGWTTPAGMQTAIEETLVRNHIGVADLDHVELYSCFPCVPKMARRVLGWPADRPVTVHGGLTFGGGPVANYMSHAIAAMVRKLRHGGGTGFLFGNGGFCEHNHCIVLSASPLPDIAFPQDYDAQSIADARRGPIPPLTDMREGQFPVETYTVVYDRNGAAQYGIVLSRTDDGARIIAKVAPDDARSLAFLTDGKAEPVGQLGHNARAGDALIWTAP